MNEIVAILNLATSAPVSWVVPNNIEDAMKQARGVIQAVNPKLTTLCSYLSKLGLGNNAQDFLTNWQDLFAIDGGKTKLEVILDVLDLANSLDFVKAYIPDVPGGCKPSLVTLASGLYQDVFRSNDRAKLPSSICSRVGAAKTCLKKLAVNIDQVDWIADMIGSGTIVALLDNIFPVVCDAIGGGLDAANIIAAIPTLIAKLKELNIPVLKDMMPGVFDVFTGACNAKLVTISQKIGYAALNDRQEYDERSVHVRC